MREWIVPLTDDADMEKFEREIGTNGELIRCEDCVHWQPGHIIHEDKVIPPMCGRISGVWLHDDYCSNAERKHD